MVEVEKANPGRRECRSSSTPRSEVSRRSSGLRWRDQGMKSCTSRYLTRFMVSCSIHQLEERRTRAREGSWTRPSLPEQNANSKTNLFSLSSQGKVTIFPAEVVLLGSDPWDLGICRYDGLVEDSRTDSTRSTSRPSDSVFSHAGRICVARQQRPEEDHFNILCFVIQTLLSLSGAKPSHLVRPSTLLLSLLFPSKRREHAGEATLTVIEISIQISS